MDSTGTVECVTAVMETLVLDYNLLRSNLPVEPHTVAGMYLVLGVGRRWAARAAEVVPLDLRPRRGRRVGRKRPERVRRDPGRGR